MSFFHRMIPNFEKYDALFGELGPAGYTLAVNISNTTPELYYSTYPEDWVREYTENKYAFLDPVMQFAAFSHGVKRWDEILAIKIPVASKHVYDRAQLFNLNYGGAIVKKSRTGGRRKHILSFARADRAVTDEELVSATSLFERLLSDLHPDDHLSDRQIKVLEGFARGLTRADVAKEVGTSQDTIKKEMERIRGIWGAKNATEAVAMAVSRRIITPVGGPIW